MRWEAPPPRSEIRLQQRPIHLIKADDADSTRREELREVGNGSCAGGCRLGAKPRAEPPPRGLKALLGSAVTEGGSAALTTCGRSIKGAAARSVEAAQREGALRADVEPVDVLRLAHGVVSASELADGQGRRIRRYLSLLTEGLRA